MDFGIFVFPERLVILSFWGLTPSWVIVLPKTSISVAPKWHLCIVSFNPASLMHSKGRPQIFIGLIGVVSCSAAIVDILGVLVCFDNSIKVFPHEAGKGSTKSLSQSSIDKSPARKVKRQHFNGFLVHHPETVLGLGTVEFADVSFRPYVVRHPSEY